MEAKEGYFKAEETQVCLEASARGALRKQEKLAAEAWEAAEAKVLPCPLASLSCENGR